jgi:hypothetical protein
MSKRHQRKLIQVPVNMYGNRYSKDSQPFKGNFLYIVEQHGGCMMLHLAVLTATSKALAIWVHIKLIRWYNISTSTNSVWLMSKESQTRIRSETLRLCPKNLT